MNIDGVENKYTTGFFGDAPRMPTPDLLGNGEIALNIHKGTESLFFKNDAGEIVRFKRVPDWADITNKPTNLLQTSGGNIDWLNIGGQEVALKMNQARNNLGNPTIEEMALYPAQYNSKFRFLSAILQEESQDGINYTSSTRLSADALKDLMIGNGQASYGNAAIPKGGGGYRLTWDANQTGYVWLNQAYIYNNTNGNTVNFKVEIYSPFAKDWIDLCSSDISNWPGHTTIKHRPIYFNPNFSNASNTSYATKIRLTFTMLNPRNINNSFDLYSIEWMGGYPIGRRNVESYDRDKNVFFPNKIFAGGSKVWDTSNFNPASKADIAHTHELESYRFKQINFATSPQDFAHIKIDRTTEEVTHMDFAVGDDAGQDDFRFFVNHWQSQTPIKVFEINAFGAVTDRLISKRLDVEMWALKQIGNELCICFNEIVVAKFNPLQGFISLKDVAATGTI